MPPVVGRPGALLAVDEHHFVSHDPNDYRNHEVSFLRVDRAGRVWLVGGTYWTEWIADAPQCDARQYRFVGA